MGQIIIHSHTLTVNNYLDKSVKLFRHICTLFVCSHCVLALFVKLVTRASITAGRKDNLSSLLWKKDWQNILFHTKQSEQWKQTFYSQLWSLLPALFHFRHPGIYFVPSTSPHCWSLFFFFTSVQEFKRITAANKVGRGLCFHPSLLVCWLAKYPSVGWNLVDSYLAKG